MSCGKCDSCKCEKGGNEQPVDFVKGCEGESCVLGPAYDDIPQMLVGTVPSWSWHAYLLGLASGVIVFGTVWLTTLFLK